MKNYILLITRSPNEFIEKTACRMSSFGAVKIITDEPTGISKCDKFEYIWINDNLLKGYEHIMSSDYDYRPYTSWSRVLYYINTYLEIASSVWIIEDDVGIQADNFEKLHKYTKRRKIEFGSCFLDSITSNNKWFWRYHPIVQDFSHPKQSFNVVCYLGPKMILSVRKHLQEYGRIGFHEISLPSIAYKNKLIILDWLTNFGSSKYFGTYRSSPPVTEIQNFICHPVKDAEIYNVICENTAIPSLFIRIYYHLRRRIRRDAICYRFLSSVYRGLGKFYVSIYFICKNYTGIKKICYIFDWMLNQSGTFFFSRFSSQPWLNYPTIDHIISFIKKHRGIIKVFEFGSGKSTLFFAKYKCEIISCEHDRQWYEKMKKYISLAHKNNVKITLKEPILKDQTEIIPETNVLNGVDSWDFTEYCKLISQHEDKSFDIILIDGRSRVKCFQQSLGKVRSGGMIIVDDMEREKYNEIMQLMPSNFEVKIMSGPGPYQKSPPIKKSIICTNLNPEDSKIK